MTMSVVWLALGVGCLLGVAAVSGWLFVALTAGLAGTAYAIHRVAWWVEGRGDCK